MLPLSYSHDLTHSSTVYLISGLIYRTNCVYDLRESKVTFAADLEKALGTTSIQGSEGVGVSVSADGGTVQLYFHPDPAKREPDYGLLYRC